MPSAPAMAVATAMITLIMVLHTDFFMNYEFYIMSYELGIPADIRGKLRFPSDGLSGRASSEETVASVRSIPV